MIIVSCPNSPIQLIRKAKDLAASLKLPFISEVTDLTPDYFILFLSENGLELKKRVDDTKKWSSLRVDFLHGSEGYRLKHDLTIHQPLAKAIGIKPGFRPDVFDATAGLGKDSFLIACLGCTVSMVERSPVLWALLKDGLKRAENENRFRSIVKRQISLINEDAILHMAKSSVKPYTIYLDPMYPPNKKSALNKVDMRIIRQLVGNDQDSPALLHQALQSATNRVVVKRPKGASTLNQTRPTHTIFMKNNRFDVYLI